MQGECVYLYMYIYGRVLITWRIFVRKEIEWRVVFYVFTNCHIVKIPLPKLGVASFSI